MSDQEFEALCAGPLKQPLEGAAALRKAAVVRFWIWLAVGLAVTLAIFLVVPPGSWKLSVAILGVVLSLALAWTPLNRAGAELKRPILAAIARQAGLSPGQGGSDPTGYGALHRAFGSPTGKRFSDHLTGFHDGRPHAFYEATLTTGSGKSRQTVFNGQIYTHQRRTTVHGTTAVVPDRGVFNFFKPGPGMERVRFESDAEFERRFEVYSTHPETARSLLTSSIRARLLHWRGQGARVFAVFEADRAGVGIGTGQDRFEAGDMMASLPARDRARRIHEDVRRSLAQARDVVETLG